MRAAVREALGEKRAPTFERRLYWRDLAYWSLWRFDDLSDAPFRKHLKVQFEALFVGVFLRCVLLLLLSLFLCRLFYGFPSS